MPPDPQLLTKQVIIERLTIVGETISVRFNLQRGKIARIWGFSNNISGMSSSQRIYSLFVRKTRSSERVETPQDLLWANIINNLVVGSAGVGFIPDVSIMFPKPHRTTGITVQGHANVDGSTRSVLIIYYDIDDVTKGELANRWEKSRQRRYTRRNVSP